MYASASQICYNMSAIIKLQRGHQAYWAAGSYSGQIFRVSRSALAHPHVSCKSLRMCYTFPKLNAVTTSRLYKRGARQCRIRNSRAMQI